VSSGSITDSAAPLDWVAVGDAIPVGPPLPPTGVWQSHENVDNFAAAGYPQLTGTFTTTESKDGFTGAPAQAPYNGIGWLGWVPATATWASTEGKDAFLAYGWVIGDPGDPYRGGITGQLNTTESKDSFAFSGNPLGAVTGTWASTELTDRLASAGFEIPKVNPPTRKKRRVLVVS
jgi:hypothetical protein